MFKLRFFCQKNTSYLLIYSPMAQPRLQSTNLTSQHGRYIPKEHQSTIKQQLICRWNSKYIDKFWIFMLCHTMMANNCSEIFQSEFQFEYHISLTGSLPNQNHIQTASGIFGFRVTTPSLVHVWYWDPLSETQQNIHSILCYSNKNCHILF